MKLYHMATALLTLIISTLSAAEGEAEALALLQKSESIMRSSATTAEYQIDIIRPDWQRSMTFKSHDDRIKQRFRMEILSPRKTKGTVFLKLDNKLSMYLPKLRRQIAISPAMMHDAWMGSDFNNQDLLETDSLISGYSHRITHRETDGEHEIISIESLPHEETTVSWLRLEHRVRSDGMPIDVTYICKKGNPARKLSFDTHREMDGRIIPTRWIMESLKEEGKRTIITLKSIDFDSPLDEGLFTPMKPKN